MPTRASCAARSQGGTGREPGSHPGVSSGGVADSILWFMRPHSVPFSPAIAAVLLGSAVAAAQEARDYPYRPVPFTQVRIHGGLLGARLETNRRVTVPYCLDKCEETGRIRNFAVAGGLEEGGFEGIYFNDSDVFKVIEGACYTLATRPDPDLRARIDDLVAKIAAAQEEDGYLYTIRTIDPELAARRVGAERFSKLDHSHELYNVGHLYEAAVAHYRATGSRTLLDVALRNADLIARVFGPDRRRDPPGHQEIEIGLVKLYRVTGNPRYLNLARFFLEARGDPEGHRLYGSYSQDHLPVVAQTEAVGHAVRAGYMYAAMADIAALTGDIRYRHALDRLWSDIVGRKTYLTGGVGSRRSGEAFGAPFELPNETAYNETCAAIAQALFEHRMFLLHGEARYLDMLERIVFNAILAGVSLDGDRFFYPNPLACDGVTRFNQGELGRSPWFSCSCCPVNVVRFLPSLPGCFYAVRGDVVLVGLYASGEAVLRAGGRVVRLRQRTEYPWQGRIRIEVSPQTPCELELRLRVPGWARGEPMPGGLYRYLDAGAEAAEAPRLAVNGEPVALELRSGFARIRRTWSEGDRLTLELPMRVRRVVARNEVAADRGRVALERGGIVYCVEAVDHGGRVRDLVLPDAAELRAEHRPDLLGGITVLRGEGLRVARRREGATRTEKTALLAVPYHVWAHRKVGEMAVWLARTEDLAEPLPPPTIASRATPSASHTWRGDTVHALNDQRLPERSSDHSIPRHTFWDHRGTREWLRYDLAEPTRVGAVAVYWFDDEGRGACRTPASWRLLYRDAHGTWRPVKALDPYGTAKDAFQRVRFEPVRTDALRIELALREGFSAGVLEWVVEPAH